MKPVKALLLGAGRRGMFTFGKFTAINPGLPQIAAVADPVDEKRRRMQEEYGIPSEYLYKSWEDTFVKLPPVEAVIIATPDKMHLVLWHYSYRG